MTPEQYIDAAIERGSREGLDALDQCQALVFLISEAEVLCDVEGIDSLIERYGSVGVLRCAEAFLWAGATQIGEGLGSIGRRLPDVDQELWSRANDLICGRVGYDSGAIEAKVASCLS